MRLILETPNCSAECIACNQASASSWIAMADYANGPAFCSGCKRRILDKYMLDVGGQSWHDRCVKCKDCGLQLRERCYCKLNEIYCRTDYLKKFGPECEKCGKRLTDDSLFRKVKKYFYHDSCFCCITCSRKLAVGDRIHLSDDGSITCEKDWGNSSDVDVTSVDPTSSTLVFPWSTLSTSREAVVNGLSFSCDTSDEKQYSTSVKSEPGKTLANESLDDWGEFGDVKDDGSDLTVNDNMADSESSFSAEAAVYDEGVASGETPAPHDASLKASSRRQDRRDDRSKKPIKKRGPRTCINRTQLDKLTETFAHNPKPSRQVREQLEKETCLSSRVIQVWFQNRRSKEKRLSNTPGRYRMRSGMYHHHRSRYIHNEMLGQNHCQSPNINILNSGFQGVGHYYDNAVFNAGFQGPPSFRYPGVTYDHQESVPGKPLSFHSESPTASSYPESAASYLSRDAPLEEIFHRKAILDEPYEQQLNRAIAENLEFQHLPHD